LRRPSAPRRRHWGRRVQEVAAQVLRGPSAVARGLVEVGQRRSDDISSYPAEGRRTDMLASGKFRCRTIASVKVFFVVLGSWVPHTRTIFLLVRQVCMAMSLTKSMYASASAGSYWSAPIAKSRGRPRLRENHDRQDRAWLRLPEVPSSCARNERTTDSRGYLMSCRPARTRARAPAARTRPQGSGRACSFRERTARRHGTHRPHAYLVGAA
jgi:hypothetical protein